jgi:hypothetical protein
VAAGVLATADGPDEVTHLAELCWLISEFWLPSLEVSGQAVLPRALTVLPPKASACAARKTPHN